MYGLADGFNMYKKIATKVAGEVYDFNVPFNMSRVDQIEIQNVATLVTTIGESQEYQLMLDF